MGSSSGLEFPDVGPSSDFPDSPDASFAYVSPWHDARRPRPCLAPHRPVPPDGCDHDARRRRALQRASTSTSAARGADLSLVGVRSSTASGTARRSWRSSARTSSATTTRAATTGVDASLPYFLPAPLPLTGTLGAFIRIRQPIPGKRELFDIGIAGPIAGFLVAVPVLLVGMSLSRVDAAAARHAGLRGAGRAAALQGDRVALLGTLPDGYTINMHPMAFAAWFGLLATALNLFPIGQLDGGHISYAVLGRKSTSSPSRRSPPRRPHVRLELLARLDGADRRHARRIRPASSADDRRRRAARPAAPVAGRSPRCVMFVLCFTPAPIELLDLVGRRP